MSCSFKKSIKLIYFLLVSSFCLPFFNELANKAIAFPFSSLVFWALLIVAGLLLSLISGAYPAFFMSRFMPAKVLKGTGEASVGGSKLRSALVVFQFAISVFLIVGTLVVGKQLSYIQNKDLGYSKDQVLLINNMNRLGNNSQTLKNEVKELALVSDATLSGYLPTPSYRTDSSYFLEGKCTRKNLWVRLFTKELWGNF